MECPCCGGGAAPVAEAAPACGACAASMENACPEACMRARKILMAKKECEDDSVHSQHMAELGRKMCEKTKEYQKAKEDAKALVKET